MVRKIVAGVLLAVGMTATAVAVPAGAAPSSLAGGTVSLMCVMCWPGYSAN